jgi:hypothetical protein
LVEVIDIILSRRARSVARSDAGGIGSGATGQCPGGFDRDGATRQRPIPANADPDQLSNGL